jgi:succinyl-CoA synthetase beta subunit
LQNDPSIAEAEVNPLIVRQDGVVAVDALIRTG